MISDLSDLRKLLRLCRAQGVTEFELDKLKIKFGDMPAPVQVESTEGQEPEIDDLTPDQLAFYSSQG